jgi:adenylate cyclase
VPEIRFLPDHKVVETKKSQTILAAALKAGIPHTHACGGNARCSTCRVMILEGMENCSEPTWKETRIVKKLGFSPSFRLACQTVATGQVSVRRLVLDPADVTLTDARQQPVPIGDEKDVAILFCDIRSFTPLAESLLPYDVIHLLNRFHFDMAQCIEAHGGIVSVTMGDGLMAIFGHGEDPGPPAAQPLRAVRAALAMLAAIDARKEDLERLYGRAFDIGIGIHFGKAVVGYMGNQLLVPTAIGDVVNVASRIEGANKKVGTRLLVSEDLYGAIPEFLEIGQRAAVALAGKEGAFTLFEVTGLKGGA